MHGSRVRRLENHDRWKLAHYLMLDSLLRVAEQIGAHAAILRVDTEIAIEKFSKNWRWSQIPACPAQRRIAVHVLGINLSARSQQHINGFFIAERGSPVQRSFALRAPVTHKATCFNAGFGA